MAKKYTWRYRGMKFDSEHAEIHSRGALRIPKAYNRQGVIWEKSRKEGYDVIVYDWDGTVLAHWTAESFLKLTEMPVLHRQFYKPLGNTDADIIRTEPAYEGEEPLALEPAGYNWTLEEAKEQVRSARFCDIGTVYDVEDNNYIWLRTTKTNVEYSIMSGGQTGNTGTFTIDYGDGTVKSQSIPRPSVTHTYSEPGLYLVKISGGSTFSPGYSMVNTSTYSYNVSIASMKGILYYNYSIPDSIRYANDDVEFLAMFCGTTCMSRSGGSFAYCEFRFLGFGKNSYPNVLNGLFNGCSLLRHLTIPRQITNLPVSTTINYGVTYMAFAYGGQSLKSIVYPPNWKGPSGFANTLASLQRYVLPTGTTNAYPYGGLKNIETAVLSGTNINNNSFDVANGAEVGENLAIWCLEKDYDAVASAVGSDYAPYIQIIQAPS